jgi:hypothetical protein
MPDGGGVIACVEAAFRMERLWDGVDDLHKALEGIADPENENLRITLGWVLGVRRYFCSFLTLTTRLLSSFLLIFLIH